MNIGNKITTWTEAGLSRSTAQNRWISDQSPFVVPSLIFGECRPGQHEHLRRSWGSADPEWADVGVVDDVVNDGHLIADSINSLCG
jgi:hypothetical protein